MKIYGFVKHIFPVNGFVTIVYTNESDYFLATNEDHKIDSFSLLDLSVYNIHVLDGFKNEYSIGDYSAYCFNYYNTFITGGYHEIYFELFKIANSFETNYFIKFSISKFLKLNGLFFRTLKESHDQYFKGGFDYYVDMPDLSCFLTTENSNIIQSYLQNIELSFEITNQKISWNDLICILDGNVYFDIYCCSYDIFMNSSVLAKTVLNEVLDSAAVNEKRIIIAGTPSLFLDFIDGSKIINITDLEEPAIAYSDFYDEKGIVNSTKKQRSAGAMIKNKHRYDAGKLKRVVYQKILSKKYKLV